VWLWDTAAQCPLAMACLNINASCREILFIYIAISQSWLWKLSSITLYCLERRNACRLKFCFYI
jgi:hypothetical protein